MIPVILTINEPTEAEKIWAKQKQDYDQWAKEHLQKPWIDNSVSEDEKLKLVYKFYTEPGVWETLIKDDRSEPPTIDQMKRSIHNSTFPALKMIELEQWYERARLYFDMTKVKGEEEID